jgi:hypothetical protein
MDNYTLIPSTPISHNVEVYTARFLVQGKISGSYRRTSDLLNRKDDDFLIVNEASISPVGQGTDAQKISTPLMLARHGIHFVSLSPAPPDSEGGSPNTQSLPREFLVSKLIFPCYILTDTYVIHGRCHLLEGATLGQYLEQGEAFIPITQPTIYLAARVSSSWQRELVIVNKEKIEVAYLVGSEE